MINGPLVVVKAGFTAFMISLSALTLCSSV
jgi:hypothetical protein